MRVQRTLTKQLRALLTTTLGSGIQKVRSAISTHVRSIINLIIVRSLQVQLGLGYKQSQRLFLKKAG